MTNLKDNSPKTHQITYYVPLLKKWHTMKGDDETIIIVGEMLIELERPFRVKMWDGTIHDFPLGTDIAFLLNLFYYRITDRKS